MSTFFNYHQDFINIKRADFMNVKCSILKFKNIETQIEKRNSSALQIQMRSNFVEYIIQIRKFDEAAICICNAIDMQ
jgi:hypothetical protein